MSRMPLALESLAGGGGDGRSVHHPSFGGAYNEVVDGAGGAQTLD